MAGSHETSGTYLGLGQGASDRHERAGQQTLGAVRADEALEVGREAERNRFAVDEFRLSGHNCCEGDFISICARSSCTSEFGLQGTMSDVCILPVAREMWIRCGRRSAIDMMYVMKMKDAMDVVMCLRRCQRSFGDAIDLVMYCKEVESQTCSGNIKAAGSPS